MNWIREAGLYTRYAVIPTAKAGIAFLGMMRPWSTALNSRRFIHPCAYPCPARPSVLLSQLHLPGRALRPCAACLLSTPPAETGLGGWI